MLRPFAALAIAVVGLTRGLSRPSPRAPGFRSPCHRKGDIEAGSPLDWSASTSKKIGHFHTRDKTDEGVRESFAMQMKIVSLEAGRR
ncbi:MAG: hypothetical protein U0744_01470 [Gemmataceae bacterium]